MTRIESIIKAARYALADPNKERYTDERLLFALSEGQKDIARQTRLLKDETTLIIMPGVAVYDLPSNLWMITRAIFDNVRIPLMSHDRMDECNLGWFTVYGNKIEALVYDKRNMHKIRVYPIPDNSYVEGVYNFVADTNLNLDPDELTGAQQAEILALIESLGTETSLPLDLEAIYTDAQAILNVVPGIAPTEGAYGVLTSIDSVVAAPITGVTSGITLEQDDQSWPGEVSFNSLYGVVTNVQDTTGLLHIYYIKDPEAVLSTEDTLLVSPIFDTALRHFIVGTAFGDDLDSQYQARSQQSLAMYDREIKTVGTPTDLTDGTRATQYNTHYTGPFSD